MLTIYYIIGLILLCVVIDNIHGERNITMLTRVFQPKTYACIRFIIYFGLGCIVGKLF